MSERSSEDPRLTRLSALCLRLPESVRAVHGNHADFRVRKKVFAYFLDDHHGDGIVALCAKVEPGENEALATTNPLRFYLPAYIGPRGWVALRLDRGKVDWSEVEAMVSKSYRLVAPKTLARQLDVADDRSARRKARRGPDG